MLRTSLTSSLAAFYRVTGPWKPERGVSTTERNSLRASDLSYVAPPYSVTGGLEPYLEVFKNPLVTISKLSLVQSPVFMDHGGKRQHSAYSQVYDALPL